MRFSEVVATGIQHLDEHWDGRGKPGRAKETQIPYNSQIALLAQVVDVFHTTSGSAAATVEARRRAGTWFNPKWVDAFTRIATDPVFWRDLLASPELLHAVLRLPPGQNSLAVDEEYLDDIAAAFAQVIDTKSPYTCGHSERVALFADMIAEQMRLAPDHRRWLRRAALPHDIGKLGVSDAILDKSDKLDDDEWVTIRAHAALSETILGRIDAFRELVPIAGAHHERLDGSGYPCGLRGDQITLETRILTVADSFDALTAERPYRAEMPINQALGLMTNLVGEAINPICFAALKAALVAVELKQAA